ncbi:MAG: histidine kinase dimerization/phospho-acceptor domain-containing protein [Dehalococcoidales bacterium]
MAINLPVPKKNSQTDEKQTSVEAELENNVKDFETAVDVASAPQLLARASKDAELAKTAVRKAISQAFKEREESVKKAETLAQAFDEVIKNNNSPNNQSPADGHGPVAPVSGTKKLTTATPQSAFADIIKAYFGNKLDTETKKDAGSPAFQPPNLRQVIERVSDDQAHKKAARILGEAKSDRIASKVVVNQAQDEVKKAREEAERIKSEAEDEVIRAREEAVLARQEAEDAIVMAKAWIEQAKEELIAEKKAAGLIASQAQQQALSQAAEEISKAKTEVKAARDAANTAIRLAKDEIAKAREEAESYKKNSQAAISALEDKVLKVTEKVNAIKQQSLISISEAQAEAQKAKEDTEKVRRECQAAIKQAQLESQKAMEEAKFEAMKARESIIKSEQRAYEQVRERMEQVKKEADTTKQSAYEVVSRAREEARQAKEEADIIKKASEDAVCTAIEARQKSEEETENAKQAMLDFANRAQADSRRAREEAETAIIRANDAMIKAQQDIIGMTINEISASRHELEETVKDPEKLMKALSQDETQQAEQPAKPEPPLTPGVLNEIRAPLHSIAGFARLMLDEDITDSATRKEFLAIVVQQSENLGRLLDDLSDKLKSDDETPAADESGRTA